MKLFVQWARKHARGWEQVDSRDWRTLPKKPVPTGGETLDDEPGWISNVCIQGMCSGTVDHVAIEHLGDSVRMTVWKDDPEDWGDFRWARVLTFHPLAPDPKLGGATNTRIDSVIYTEGEELERLLADPPLDSEVRPWSEFVQPPDEITRHNIWLPDKLHDAHRKLARPVSWREWGEDGTVPCQRDLGLWSRARHTVTYYWRGTNGGGGTGDDADSDVDPTASGLSFKLTKNSTTQHLVQRDIPAEASDEITFAFTTEAGEPGDADWPEGDYRAQINIDDLEDSNVSCKVQILRVNSSGTVQETIGTSGSYTTAATHLFTVSSYNPSAGADTDRYQIRVLGSNAYTHQPRYIMVGVRSTDSFADGPWTASVQDSDYRLARTKGKADTSSNRLARTRGGTATSANRLARTKGEVSDENSSRLARLKGQATGSPFPRRARTHGKVSDFEKDNYRRGRVKGQDSDKVGDPVTYYLRNIAHGDVTDGALNYSLQRDTGSLTQITDTVPGTVSDRISFTMSTDYDPLNYRQSPQPPTPWPSGNYRAQVDVTVIGPDIQFRLQLVRIKTTNGDVLETLGTSDYFSGTGIHSVTFSGIDPGDTGRLQLRVIADNSDAGAQYLGLSFNGTLGFVDGPWVYNNTSYARTKGKVSDENDNRLARTDGKVSDENDYRLARTAGKVTGASAYRLARIEGTVAGGTTDDDYRLARTAGSVAGENSNRLARTSGQVADENDYRLARVDGKATTSDSRLARTAGKVSDESASRLARTKGGATDSALRRARTAGRATTTAVRRCRIAGAATASSRMARTSGVAAVSPIAPNLAYEFHPDPSFAGGRKGQPRSIVVRLSDFDPALRSMFPNSKKGK